MRKVWKTVSQKGYPKSILCILFFADVFEDVVDEQSSHQADWHTY